jgi:hypothetical protein
LIGSTECAVDFLLEVGSLGGLFRFSVSNEALLFIFIYPRLLAITRELYKCQTDGNPSKTLTTIEFSITVTPKATDASEMEMADVVPTAVAAVQQMAGAPSLLDHTQSAIDGSTNIINSTQSIIADWSPLLKKIELFTKVVDGISEVTTRS